MLRDAFQGDGAIPPPPSLYAARSRDRQ